MKQMSRRRWTGLLVGAGFSVAGLIGCSGSGGPDGESDAVGQMNLPLTTQGPSGTTYRLRNATFVIQNQYYDYESVTAGAAGASNTPGTIVVSSETDPNATNISLSLPEGYYNVQLLSGWRMEKVTSSGAQAVEATLLSSSTQTIYVYRQSSSWAEYRFGIGGREIWLNGKLTIAIDVQEMSGVGGAAGAAGEGPDAVGGAIDIPVGGAGGEAG